MRWPDIVVPPLNRYWLLAQALRRRPALRQRERWPRERIEDYQRRRLAEIVAEASRQSPFYRRLYGGHVAAGDVQLESLPAVTKHDWMASFEDVVTDGRLHLEGLYEHIETLSGDTLYLGEYRVMASSGTGGVPGIYVWSRQDWLSLVVTAMRVADRLGYGPRWPQLRVVNITAPSARHMSYRVSVSLDVGITRRRRLDATTPIDQLVEAVGQSQPDILTGYPSIVSALASAQLAGSLDIAPGAVSVSGEILTPEMRSRIREAWGVSPFNVYAMSEAGVVAVSCEHGTLHANEDSVILEPVDGNLKPVPPGVPGDKLLVTSLLNRTQPVIRLEVSDQLTFGTTSCPCGRGLRPIEHIQGRADDLLLLPSADGGGMVSLHPVHLRAQLGSIKELDGYQVTLDGNIMSIDILTRHEALGERVRDSVAESLLDRGVAPIEIRVNSVAALEREKGGKLKPVRVISRA